MTNNGEAGNRVKGNIFEALELENAQELLAKAQMLSAIIEYIREHKLTQNEVARMTGLDQPKVSQLTRGKLSGFSTERLMRILNCLGQDVQIVIVQNAPDEPARVGKTRVVMQHALGS